MKSTLYTAVAALLIFSSCTTAYQTARTPDDVYYSPRSERTYASNNNNRNGNYQQDGRVVQGTDDDSNYVTYDDGEKGDYARRIERFRNPYNGSYYDDGYTGSPNIYMNNYYGGGPFGGSGLGLGFGWGSGWGSPWYNSWGPSISLGFNWGWGGGFNRPWYDPWYGGGGWYGGGWGSPWYPHAWGGGGWGYPGWGGWHGGPVYIVNTPPRRTRGSYNGSDYPAPRRSFGDSGPIGSGGNNGYRPRRVFAEENGGVNNPGGRTYTPGSNGGYQPRRVFNAAPSERPVIGNQPGNNGGFQPRRVFQETSRPQQPQMQQPQRSYQSTPSYSPSPSSGGGGGGSRGGAGRTRG